MTDAPILEFDPDRRAIIEPSAWHAPIDGLASAAVITWMPDAYAMFIDGHDAVEIHRLSAETIDIAIHQVTIDRRPVAAALAPVGAPATAALVETLIAIGCRSVVSVGSSGGLSAEHPPGTVVVPSAAIRDEGVSYHYAPAARLAYPDDGLQQALRVAFSAAGHQPIGGLIWTTDALFRETATKVGARTGEGAVAVDMEVAAIATIARFRNVGYGAAVYLADTLHSDRWDPTELIERDSEYRLGLLRVAAGVAATS